MNGFVSIRVIKNASDDNGSRFDIDQQRHAVSNIEIVTTRERLGDGNRIHRKHILYLAPLPMTAVCPEPTLIQYVHTQNKQRLAHNIVLTQQYCGNLQYRSRFQDSESLADGDDQGFIKAVIATGDLQRRAPCHRRSRRLKGSDDLDVRGSHRNIDRHPECHPRDREHRTHTMPGQIAKDEKFQKGPHRNEEWQPFITISPFFAKEDTGGFSEREP